MKLTFLAPLAICATLLGCKSPTLVELEYSCSGQEQSLGTFRSSQPQKPLNSQYPIEIDFHLRKNKVLVKTYLANVVADDGVKVAFAIEGRYNWLKGQFNRSDSTLSFVTRQTLNLDGETMETQLSGQYVCKKA